jgi:hypothetical protein
VLVPEVEELVGQVERRLVAGLARPGPLGHQPHEPLAVERHLLGQHEDRRLDVGEVLVEGRRRRARLAGDVDDLDRAVGRGAQHLGRALEQALAGGAAPAPRHPAVGRPQILPRLHRLGHGAQGTCA